MRRPIRIILIAVVCAFAVMTGSTALAAPATWQSVDVTLHAEQAGGTMLVSGQLPPAASLPAEAELAVPTGSAVQWIGEILGGPVAEDPEVKYTKTTAGGVDVYRFTLTKSRIAQIEVPVSQAQTFDGTSYSTALKWTASQPVPSVRLAVALPTGANVVQPATGATMQAGDGTESYYTKTVTQVKAGDTLDLAFGYTAPVAPVAATDSAKPGASSVVAQVIIILVVLAGAALLIVAVGRKMKSRAVADADSNDADDSKRRSKSGAAATSGPPKRPGNNKRILVTGACIVVLVVVAGIAVSQGSKPTMNGDTLTKTFSQGAPCANATIALSVPSGADPVATGEKLFSALGQVKGITTATFNAKTSSLEIGYCESLSSEAALKQALAPTGFVASGGTGGS